MIALRSVLFAIAFYAWSGILSPFYLPLMLAPRRLFWRCCLSWCRSCIAIVHRVAGIGYEIRGLENIPPGRVILASKHQSAWDTLIFNAVVLDCAYVVKWELFKFPFFGWFLWRVGMVGVDRAGGASSLKRLIADCQACLAGGRAIVIFPQGTRTPPGAKRPYLPGVSALYTQCDAAVVPVALNSGLFWPRRRFLKFPGKITLSFLPPIEPGLPRREFAAKLEASIETASDELHAEARRAFDLPE